MRLAIYHNREKCFCAFCKSPRTIYRSRHISVVHILASAVTAVVLSALIWQDIDPRALVFIGLSLGVGEIFSQVRWRLAIPCQECGFDSVLYLRDSNLAAQKVKARLERRKSDPKTLLKRSPILNIPVRKASDIKKQPRPSRVPRDRALISAEARAALVRNPGQRT